MRRAGYLKNKMLILTFLGLLGSSLSLGRALKDCVRRLIKELVSFFGDSGSHSNTSSSSSSISSYSSLKVTEKQNSVCNHSYTFKNHIQKNHEEQF